MRSSATTMEIETLRGRLLIRLTLGLGFLWSVLMAFGFIPTMVEGIYGIFSLHYLPIWANIVAWCAATPMLILVMFVVIERTDSWQHFAGLAIVLFLLVFAVQAAGSLLTRLLVDGMIGRPALMFFRLMITLLFTIVAWSVILFVSIISKLALERMEASLEIADVRRRTIEAGLREQFIRTQPARMVRWLRSIAELIPRNQEQATTELIGLGDYLRDLLRHSRRNSVTVGEELAMWRSVRGGTDLDVETTGDVGEVGMPAGLLVAVFERIGQWAPGSRIGLAYDERLELSIECRSAESGDRLEAELNGLGLDVTRISEREVATCLALFSSEDPEPRPETSTILGSTDRGTKWAIGIVAGMALLAGLTSTTQIAIARAAGWTDLPLEFHMSAWVELAEWLTWGSIGIICMIWFLRSEERAEWLGGAALLTWLLLPHLLWASVIQAVAGLDYLSSAKYAFEQWDFALRSGFVVVGGALFRGLRDIDDLIAESKRLQESLGEYRMTRLRMIRSQLQPHFLLNALHAVNAMIIEDPDRAVRLAQNLGSLLEETAGRVEKGFLRLGEEIAMARRYLEVLSVRYEGRLMFEIDWDERLADVEIPALATQPLLENALVHGVETSLTGSLIGLHVRSLDSDLVITVTNPAREGRSGPVRIGLGLANTDQTLRLCYGDRYLFEAGIVGSDYVARMQIPKRRAA